MVPPLTRALRRPDPPDRRFHGAQNPWVAASGTRTSTRYPRNAGTGESCTSEWMTRGSLWRPNSRASSRERRLRPAGSARPDRGSHPAFHGGRGLRPQVDLRSGRRSRYKGRRDRDPPSSLCGGSSGPTDGPWAQREAALQRIRKIGRREWQKESGYRQQARVENSVLPIQGSARRKT